MTNMDFTINARTGIDFAGTRFGRNGNQDHGSRQLAPVDYTGALLTKSQCRDMVRKFLLEGKYTCKKPEFGWPIIEYCSHKGVSYYTRFTTGNWTIYKGSEDAKTGR